MITRATVVVLSLLGIAACVVPVSRHGVAVPAALPPTVQGLIEETVVGIDLPSARLSLELQELSPVALWVSIVPTEGALTLDPNAVGLAVGGQRHTPLSYIGPADPWTSPRALYQGCGPRVYALGWSPSKVDVSVEETRTGNPEKGIHTLPGSPIEIRKEQCFMFFFDRSATPDHRYVIDLQGLRSDGRAVAVPVVAYQAGETRKWVAVP